MSDVEILYKTLIFTFSMTYKAIAKYDPIDFPEIFTLFLKFRSLNVNSSVIDLTEFCFSHFSLYRGTPIIANKKVIRPKTANGHMQTLHNIKISRE